LTSNGLHDVICRKIVLFKPLLFFSDEGNLILDVSGGNAYVVGLNTSINGTQSRKFSTLWTYAAGRSGKVRRVGFFLKEAKLQVTTPVTNMFPLEVRASAEFRRGSSFNIAICTENVCLLHMRRNFVLKAHGAAVLIST
jgi:hypothetical protein